MSNQTYLRQRILLENINSISYENVSLEVISVVSSIITSLSKQENKIILYCLVAFSIIVFLSLTIDTIIHYIQYIRLTIKSINAKIQSYIRRKVIEKELLNRQLKIKASPFISNNKEGLPIKEFNLYSDSSPITTMEAFASAVNKDYIIHISNVRTDME